MFFSRMRQLTGLPLSMPGLKKAGLLATTVIATILPASGRESAKGSTRLAAEPPSKAGSAMMLRSRPHTVGAIDNNLYVVPTGQLLTPAGRQVELKGIRPQVLALSPDGTLLATSGRTNALVLIDALSGQVLQAVSLGTNAPNPSPTNATQAPTVATAPQPMDAATNSVSATSTNSSSRSSSRTNKLDTTMLSLMGLTFSPDGRHLYVSTVDGHIRAFTVDKNRHAGKARLVPVPEARAPKQKKEIPTGLAVSRDGTRLYVAGNLANKLYELDAETGKVLRSWRTGVAPMDVLLKGRKAYVSNLGGRRPETNDITALAGRGTKVRVDRQTQIVNEGSVTVIDLEAGHELGDVLVGLHPTDLALSPNGHYVAVANAGSDTVSVIDTRTDRVVEKIWVRQNPGDPFGAQPNALAFDPSGERLYVCNGTQNAVAVVEFEPEDNASALMGLIPVGWFPGAIQVHPEKKTLYVGNIKGLGAIRRFKTSEPSKLGSKDFYGTISFVPAPSRKELAAYTAGALANMHYPKLAEAKLPPRPGVPAQPVPERAGEPSVFKHVIYVIKENRTYDQVLGDMPEGNGNADLCTFGEKHTPNQHKISREFILLDNTYCASVQSADGHQWTDSAIANAYMERQVTADFPRSYPGGKAEDGQDALAWSSSGFIWDLALAHGKTFRNYGEWMLTETAWKPAAKRKDKPAWVDVWKDYTNKTGLLKLASRPAIESLRPYSPTNTVGWDLNVPDQMRADAFIEELHQFEKNGGFPNLIILFLPNDHTGGTRGKSPKPGSQVADNDLAFGRVVEAVSRSKFWPETCLFAIEDDAQNGWDHVSGYRTTCYIVSPYTKRRETISTRYNQVSMIRTMELILGLPPMNQMDATAIAMRDCFMATPDYTPFTHVPNRVPLDEMNPDPKKVANHILRKDALASARLPLEEVDRCPEDVFNRILWRAMKGTEAPYPEWAIKLAEDDDD